MSNFLKDLDLSSDALDVLLVIDFLFLKNFDSDLNKIKVDDSGEVTFSPVKTWVPCFTWPNVPLPSAFPKINKVNYCSLMRCCERLTEYVVANSYVAVGICTCLS